MRLGLMLLLFATPVFAETVDVVTKGTVTDYHYQHKHYQTINSKGEITVHDKTVDTSNKRTNEIGAGLNMPLIKAKEGKILAEYRYDWHNGAQSLYFVVEPKKDVWSHIKSGWNKIFKKEYVEEEYNFNGFVLDYLYDEKTAKRINE